MIIMVEGPDGMGKTTLCSELSGRLNCPVYKPKMHPNGMHLTDDLILGHDTGSVGLAMDVANRADVILDRSFPTQVAYSNAFVRSVGAEYGAMDSRMAKVPHLGVMLLAPDDPVVAFRETVKARGVNDIKEYQWVSIHEGYRLYLANSHMLWLTLDGTSPVLTQVEAVMDKIVTLRDLWNTKHQVFMEMARNAARRSTCLSRRQGAVIVSESGHVIAVGYNGAPVGFPHPRTCERLCIGQGKELDKCNDSHAEENCIVHAALNGSNPKGGTLYTIMSPCPRCARMIINSRIFHVVYEREYDPDAVRMLAGAGLELTRIGGEVGQVL